MPLKYISFKKCSTHTNIKKYFSKATHASTDGSVTMHTSSTKWSHRFNRRKRVCSVGKKRVVVMGNERRPAREGMRGNLFKTRYSLLKKYKQINQILVDDDGSAGSVGLALCLYSPRFS